MAIKTIYVVRHGATKLNNQTDLSEDRIRGWANVPLSAEGIAEAHKAAADLISMDVDVVISSDLRRAADTAHIIGQTIHVPVHLTPLLRPWNLGDLQGQSTKHALPIIEKFVLEAPDQSVPGGESFHQFTRRASRGLQQAISVAGDKTPCLVTHHRDERFFCAWRDKGFPPDFSIKLSTFLQKGEAPGAVRPFEIPLDRLFAGQDQLATGETSGTNQGTNQGNNSSAQQTDTQAGQISQGPPRSGPMRSLQKLYSRKPVQEGPGTS